MPPPERRSVPDNLDPLVDTLSNVVGILVIVMALTQIQLGEALARVVELDAIRDRAERHRETDFEDSSPLGQRRVALLRRTDGDVDEASRMAQRLLESLEALPTVEANGEEDSPDLASLEARLESSQEALADQARLRDRRSQYRERLRRVPKRMVARLPDPHVDQGKESWILVRYGRVFLTDREKLFRVGSRAIDRILDGGGDRQIRMDEFESVSRYLRKREIGRGDFRWKLKTEPDVRVELAWRTPHAGIEFGDLADDPEMLAWLAGRSPKIDLIRFHVWADSFEAYLAAREVVEAAGFRAGWRGHEIDDELNLGLSFGPPAPSVGPVEVD